MEQDWTRAYFESQIQSCKLHFGHVFVHWLEDLKQLVPEHQRDPIEEEFQLIWQWLNSIIFIRSTARRDIALFFQQIQTLKNYINVVKIDRRAG